MAIVLLTSLILSVLRFFRSIGLGHRVFLAGIISPLFLKKNKVLSVKGDWPIRGIARKVRISGRKMAGRILKKMPEKKDIGDNKKKAL